jgi:hypothetical protein
MISFFWRARHVASLFTLPGFIYCVDGLDVFILGDSVASAFVFCGVSTDCYIVVFEGNIVQ